MSSKSDSITLHTPSSATAPSNVRITSCSANAIQVSWDPLDGNSIEVLGVYNKALAYFTKLERQYHNYNVCKLLLVTDRSTSRDCSTFSFLNSARWCGLHNSGMADQTKFFSVSLFS